MIESLRKRSPLIHCITNPISINQCANAALCVGARPIMAEHPHEVKEISETADMLVFNTGNITDARMESILISAQTGKPFVLDPAGITCSELRRKFVQKLLSVSVPSVIKGNYSEIYALSHPGYRSAGIDSSLSDIESAKEAAVSVAKKYGTVTVASGKVDIITDGKQIIYIKNGTPHLGKITGTGCMLGVLCGCFFDGEIYSAAYACATLGICGELAEYSGNGSFYVNLMDKLSQILDKDIENNIKMEVYNLEQI